MPERIDASRRVVIENVEPELDCGRYAVKREVGDTVTVEADIFKEGHDAISAAVWYRAEDEEGWR
jgi:starch synthase (maltosyl-transferring)